jgi:hypothetical protein
MTRKHVKCWHSFQENYKTGDCQKNCQIYCWVAEGKGWRGLASSEAEKRVFTRSKSRGCRNTSHSRSYGPTGWKKNLNDGDNTWTCWCLNSDPLGISALKEGEVVAVEEWSLQERLNHKKMPRAGTLGKEKRALHL